MPHGGKEGKKAKAKCWGFVSLCRITPLRIAQSAALRLGLHRGIAATVGLRRGVAANGSQSFALRNPKEPQSGGGAIRAEILDSGMREPLVAIAEIREPFDAAAHLI
jgi:hypothetical protein